VSADAGVFLEKTLQRHNKSLNYTNNSALFFVFLLHIARLVHYVGPVGLQYDKERLSTICAAKVL